MNRKFTLFQSHLDLAHKMWPQLIDRHSVVIDSTCGNGHDSAFLASLNPLKLFCLDVQIEAIEATQKRLKGCDCEVLTFQQCHSTFPKDILESSVSLIVYNLGYLPGGDKNLTTQVATTLESLNQAIKLLKTGGVISITCYPGHEEGAKEELSLIEWGQSLDPAEWSFSVHQFKNRQKSPSLLLIQKNAL